MLVHHFLENSATRFPDKIALIYGDRRLTYLEINQSADRLASALAAMGVKRQDRVAIFHGNTAETVISVFAVLKAGAIFVLLNPAMKEKKLNYILRDSGARALIVASTSAPIIYAALNNVTDLENIIWIGNTPSTSQDFSKALNHYLWDVIQLNRSASRLLKDANIDLDLATIIYTSGSTGEPKGVMSAHYNVVSAAKSITQYLQNTPEDIILSVLPLSFDYGLYQLLMTFLFGGTLILGKSFAYPRQIIELLVAENVTGFPIVPTMLALLLQGKHLSSYDLRSLRYITNTAAALPTTHIAKLRRLLPHVRIYSMYGLTECKRVSYLPPDELDHRPDSVGIPIPNEEVFIVDDDGHELGPNQIGQLVVRGSNVMRGYWNAPEQTAQTFRPGRYPGESLLYTGDLFKKDEDGFLYFVARNDDLIKTKGERVSPKEIENIICEIEGVAEAAVIPIPDDLLGQAIKAFVVKDHENNLSENQIRVYCQKNLEPFMVPKQIVFQDSLPKSPSGKIAKRLLN